MSKTMKIVGLALATTGLAYAVKKFMHKEHRSDWHKVTGEGEAEKRTGTRYGANTIKY